MAWDLEAIRDRWRALTGRSTTTEISDADVDTRINEFYQYRFPMIASVQGLLADWTQEATVDDDGEYALDSGEIDLRKPITANGDELTRWLDATDFWRKYTNEEDYISDPTLAAGSSNAAAVANSAFKYQISSWTYSKAAAETALSGDAVPQNKYGAWMLSIDTSGTINVTEAGDNGSGYATPGKAVDALSSSNVTVEKTISAFADLGGGEVQVTTSTAHGFSTNDTITISGTTNYDDTYTITRLTSTTFKITATWVADDGTGTASKTCSAETVAVMGFVTAINADGDFTPGTTSLSASGVTATYTDGDPRLRGRPEGVLIAADTLYLRPKPNDTYMLRAKLSLSEPSELSGDTSTPADESWGPLIAAGAAVEYLSFKGEYSRVQEIMGDAAGSTPGTYNFLLNIVNRKELKQWQGRRVMREF